MDINWRLIRVRLFEMGHSFEEIDSLNMRDLTDVLEYWAGKEKARESLRRNKIRE